MRNFEKNWILETFSQQHKTVCPSLLLQPHTHSHTYTRTQTSMTIVKQTLMTHSQRCSSTYKSSYSAGRACGGPSQRHLWQTALCLHPNSKCNFILSDAHRTVFNCERQNTQTTVLKVM